jgi:hypothetical protein
LKFFFSLKKKKSSLMSSSSYFDDEAKKLFRNLGLSESGAAARSAYSSSSMYQNLNVIFEHPATKAKIYCGNQTAASDLGILTSHGVTRVVNCTNGFGQIPNYHEGKLNYFRFHISDFRSRVSMTDDSSVHAFVDPVFDFVNNALEKGENVFVHCLAGAHRAGTTSIMLIMLYEKLDVASAISAGKSRRSAIDPICDFPIFLKRVHEVKIKNAVNSRANQ